MIDEERIDEWAWEARMEEAYEEACERLGIVFGCDFEDDEEEEEEE